MPAPTDFNCVRKQGGGLGEVGSQASLKKAKIKEVGSQWDWLASHLQGVRRFRIFSHLRHKLEVESYWTVNFLAWLPKSPQNP